MPNKLALAALASVLCAQSVVAATPHVYHGRTHRHRAHCGGGNGLVGTVGGGVGGAVVGHALIGGPVGLVAGAVGGGLLGRHLDKTHTRHRHHC